MSQLMIIADRREDKQVAISRGLALAKKLDCTAQVLSFCYESLAPLDIREPKRQAEARRKILSRRKEEVEAEVRKANRAEVRVSTTVAWQKDIHHWIIRECARKSYIAVIKTGHRSETFLYNSTDWYLLRECPAPVMIVAEKKWRSTLPVLAAIDLSSKKRVKQRLNRNIITQARDYAEALDVPLHLVHALYIPPVLTELDLVDEEQRVDEIERKLKPELGKLSREYGIPLKQFRLKHGPVDKVITSEAARLKAQLVVMGTVGRAGVKARLLGNTAESVLRRLRTDVLALKP